MAPWLDLLVITYLFHIRDWNPSLIWLSMVQLNYVVDINRFICVRRSVYLVLWHRPWRFNSCVSAVPDHKSSNLYENLLVQTKWQFCQGAQYFWLFCYTSNLWISYRLIYNPTHSFCSTQQHDYQSFLVTSWFDSVCVIVA